MTIENSSIESISYKGNGQFVIHWKMTEWCNYRCSYCFQKGSYMPSVDTETIMRTASGIGALIKREHLPDKFSKVSLSLIGGEVGFLNLSGILRTIGYKFSYVDIITNLAAPKGHWKELADYSAETGQKLKINASYHEEFADWNEFLDKCRMLKDFVTVIFVLTDGNTSQVEAGIKGCAEHGIKYSVHIERSPDGTVNSAAKEAYGRLCNGQKAEHITVRLADGSAKEYSSKSAMLLDCAGSRLDAFGLYCSMPYKWLSVLPDGRAKKIWCGQDTVELSSYRVSLEAVKCTRHGCPYCGHPHIQRIPFTGIPVEKGAEGAEECRL